MATAPQPPTEPAAPRFRRWLQRASLWLLPARCLLCAAPGRGRDLCTRCEDALPWNRACCARCGLPLPLPAASCGACLRRAPAFDACHAVFRYQPPLDRLLPRLKFHGDLAAGALLSALMLESLRARLAAGAIRPQALVPVPLHRARLAARGYNQALELARPLARGLAIPLAGHLLERQRATAAQTGLDRAGRRGNVRHAFEARGPVPAHVAVLDDTMATGATVEDCARALRAAGARRVDVWVAARAE